MVSEVARIGQRGTFVVPARFREYLDWKEGDLILCDVHEGTVVLRKARAVPVDPPSPQRRAEFILNSAIDAADYARARHLVQGMGLNPDAIPHDPPPSPPPPAPGRAPRLP